ncbi:MAG: histidinol-phosphate transaminase [Clostridiaceae bacterium]|nr:histidinol-phosphate transaminase [Clostridiaceae bacterium]
MYEQSDAKRLWNRKVRILTPYVPGEQPREPNLVKLNTNENPYPPAPGVQEAIRRFPADRLRLYPDPASTDLRRSLAEYYGVSRKQVFVGNGSDEILAFAFQAFFNPMPVGSAPIDPPERIVFPDITYSFYPVYARMYDVPYREVPLDDRFQIQLRLMELPSAGIVLANPNAPTGIPVDPEALRRLAACDRNRLLLIDEAYIDFGGQSAVELLPEFDNILIVQTLSKSRSLAGLRVGFALGAPALIEALERIRDSFNSYTLDRLAQVAAEAALASSAWFETTRAQIIATREQARAELTELGFMVLPSVANFLFVRHPARSGSELYQALRDRGILVRHFSRPRINDFLRITIGTDQEMTRLSAALRAILASSAK